jgi:hypothetical protein
LGKNLWGPIIYILKRQLIDFDWVVTHKPPHSHNFANMKVIWRYGNLKYVIRNGEAILNSRSAAFLTFRFKPKRKRSFFIFGEEPMRSYNFYLEATIYRF